MPSRTQVNGGEGADKRPARATAAPVATVSTGPAEKVSDEERRAFFRAENEDDDGYDPYSDRRPMPEPLFERDPWG